MKQATCAVENCKGPLGSRPALGWCTKHYQRWRHHGTTDSLTPSRELSPLDKFELYVIPVDDPVACWGWAGPRRSGYATINYKGQALSAHRLSYEWAKGTIPAGLTIDHLCRNTRCTNPRHLEAVSAAVNTLRGISFSAINKVKTHCPAGHLFDAKNTYVFPSGSRTCRKCRVRLNREYRARKRVALLDECIATQGDAELEIKPK